tara:strand:+ start:10622 stop:11956 length:1335 start_codon:yes stop_codon:yes gene_type:complete
MRYQSGWLKSGIYSTFNRLTIAGFGFINFFILIRLISKDDFGIWVLFISVATILESIRRSFIYNSLVRHINIEDAEERTTIISSSLVLNVFSAIVAILLLLGLREVLVEVWNAPALSEMLLIYTIGQLLFTVVVHFNSVSESYSSFAGTFFSSLVQRLSFLIIVVSFYFYGYEISLVYLAYFHVTSIALGALFAVFFGMSYQAFSGYKTQWILKHFHYGKYTFGTNLGSMIFKNTDSWMLGSIISNEAVAIYNPAIRISNLFEVPLGAISSVVFPNMVRRIKENGIREAKYLYEKTVALSLAVITPFAVLTIVFARSITIFIAGEPYEDSYELLQITMLYGLVVPFNRQFGITMNAIGRSNINFYVLLANTILNVALNWILIHSFGLVGAAIATLISYLLVLLVSEIILSNMINVNILNVGKYFFSSYRQIFNTLISLNGKKKA